MTLFINNKKLMKFKLLYSNNSRKIFTSYISDNFYDNNIYIYGIMYLKYYLLFLFSFLVKNKFNRDAEWLLLIFHPIYFLLNILNIYLYNYVYLFKSFI